MPRLVVELGDDAVRRLAERVERDGIEPSALAQRLLSDASEVNPFGFVGSVRIRAVNGDTPRSFSIVRDSARFGR